LTRNPRRALIVAAFVAAVILAQELVQFLTSLPFGGGGFAGYFGLNLLTFLLPFVAGVFVSCLLLPPWEAAGIWLILARALLASAAGAILVTLVSLVTGTAVTGAFPGLISTTVNLAPVVMVVVLVDWILGRRTAA
jgi:hypothetical protein